MKKIIHQIAARRARFRALNLCLKSVMITGWTLGGAVLLMHQLGFSALYVCFLWSLPCVWTVLKRPKPDLLSAVRWLEHRSGARGMFSMQHELDSAVIEDAERSTLKSWSPKISAAFEQFRAEEGADFRDGLPLFKLECSLTQLTGSILFFAAMLLTPIRIIESAKGQSQLVKQSAIELQTEIDELQEMLASVDNELSDLSERLEDLDSESDAKTIESSLERIATLEEELAERQQSIDDSIREGLEAYDPERGVDLARQQQAMGDLLSQNIINDQMLDSFNQNQEGQATNETGHGKEAQGGENQSGSQSSTQQNNAGLQSASEHSSGQQNKQSSGSTDQQGSGLSNAQQQALLEHLQQLQQQRGNGGQKGQGASSNSFSNQQLQQLANQGKLGSSSSSNSSGESGDTLCPPGEQCSANGKSGGGHEPLTYANQKDFELNGIPKTLPSAVTVDWNSTIQLGPAAGVSYLGVPGEQARAAGATKTQSGTAQSQQIHPRHRETVGDFFSDD